MAKSRGREDIAETLLTPVVENRLLSKSRHSAFSSGVTAILLLTMMVKFMLFQNYYYVADGYFEHSLNETQIERTNKQLLTYDKSLLGLYFLTAITADSYINKWLLTRVLLSLGVFSSVFGLTIAFLNVYYSFDDQFELKNSLFTCYLVFESFNELLMPLVLSLLLDQIGLTEDFVKDTSKIFTLFEIGLQIARTATYGISYLTTSDKTNAAFGLLITSVVSRSIIVIAIYCKRETLTCEPPVRHSVIKAMLHFIWDGLLKCKKVAKRKRKSRNEPAQALSVAANDSRIFWKLVIVTLCFLPFKYLTEMVSSIGSTNYWPENSKQTNLLFFHLIMLFCLIFVQFGICPFLYRCNFIARPTRRIMICFMIVGIVSYCNFFMAFANRSNTGQDFKALSGSGIVVYNLLPTPSKLVYDEVFGEVSLTIDPYYDQVILFDSPKKIIVNLLNTESGVDDIHIINVDRAKNFVITSFGLEEIQVDDSVPDDDKMSKVNLLCFEMVCRGEILLECDRDRHSVELPTFGGTVHFNVLLGSTCTLKQVIVEQKPDALYNNFTVTKPVHYFAIIDFSNGDSVVCLERETMPLFSEWAFMPAKIVCEVVNLIIHIAYVQFILVESPPAVRTTILAVDIFSNDAAELLASLYLMTNNFVNSDAGHVAFAIFVLAMIVCAYIMYTFHTDERIKELNKRRAAIERLAYATTEAQMSTSLSKSLSLSNKGGRGDTLQTTPNTHTP